jgi:CubicO group peptidase (beta-lactamase class C family)
VPLGMDDCWVGLPADRYEAYGDPHRLHARPPRVARRAVCAAWTRPACSPSRMPGANGRGPMNQLGRFYEMLVGRGSARRCAASSPGSPSARSRRAIAPTCSTRRYGVVMDWGLGLVIDWYATGRYSSRRAFGHGGHQSSVAFCDPEHDSRRRGGCITALPGRERTVRALTRSAARSTSMPESRRPGRPSLQAVPGARTVTRPAGCGEPTP